MSFPFFIARRYLVSKKSRNLVNLISVVALIGIALSTAAIIIVLSVFNGFEDLTKQLYSNFDPDLKVTVKIGKGFTPDSTILHQIEHHPMVDAYSLTLEENALLTYDGKQEIATLKGVDTNYPLVTHLDSTIMEGEYSLYQDDIPRAIVGLGLAYKLRIGVSFTRPVHIYMVRNNKQVSLNPDKDLSQQLIYPIAKFAIDEEIDSQYMLVPLDFMQSMMTDTSRISAIEIRLKPSINPNQARDEIASLLGDSFNVKTQYQQKEFAYKVLQSEKFIAFMILLFVLLIASLNVVASLAMLMIEKKHDLFIMQAMGAHRTRLIQVFLLQGELIVLFGTLVGMLMGILACWLQQTYGFIRLGAEGAYIIDAYPVSMHPLDFLYSFIAILAVTFLSFYFPIRYFIRKYT